MTLDDLRVFVTVCGTGSLSAAAKALDRTQPAVSQHVKRIEHEVGLALLDRRPRGAVPTEAGRLLNAAVSTSLTGLDGALRQLREMREGGGTVRVRTGAASVRHFMAEGVAEFGRTHPGVHLEFGTENSNRRCVEAVRTGRADLGWISMVDQHPDVVQRPVCELGWTLAVREDHPLAARASIAPAELGEVAHIGLPPTSASRRHLDEQLRAAGVALTAAAGATDWDTAILLVQLGLGQAVVPALPAWRGAPPAGLRIIAIPSLLPLTTGWVARDWDSLPPAARAFAQAVSSQVIREAHGVRASVGGTTAWTR